MIEFIPGNQTGHRVLLTPGPLTTTATVRAAMRDDIGTWDDDAIELVQEIRDELVSLASLGNEALAKELTCTLMQGCGSMGAECMLGSVVPRGTGKVLILNNGAYGIRMIRSATAMGLPFVEMRDHEEEAHSPARVAAILQSDPTITHVAAVHCETTTGLVNPIHEIGLAVGRAGRRFIVDAISSFGAYPIDFTAGPIDHLVASSNKCVEGVPGFSFILSRKSAMKECEGQARSYAMDLYDQWYGFEQRGKFRFTPPTHVLLAFRQALRELRAEGGIPARERRYKDNRDTLISGMKKLGFEPLIPSEIQSHIITTFLIPNEHFQFDPFYRALRERGFIIYPGKLTHRDTFRIGNIGSIAREEIEAFLRAVESTLAN